MLGNEKESRQEEHERHFTFNEKWVGRERNETREGATGQNALRDEKENAR